MERADYETSINTLYCGVVSSSGIDGRNGSDGRDGLRGGTGTAGNPGTNATPATDGQNAREMRVVLKRAIFNGRTGIQAHCLTPANTPPEQQWLLQGDDMILLEAKGGDGGHGGNGGNGGDGGEGVEGLASSTARVHLSSGESVYFDQPGTRGGAGGNGGNGGNGTSGGNGGSGAYIEIEVEEKDMDLLLPIHWDVRGGHGGRPGKNGRGGRGGDPGSGGKINWHWGKNGLDGNAILLPGQDGPPGAARIQVHYESTREQGARHGFYTSRYYFSLFHSSTTDDNQDGIYEPGEHVYIHNIVIKNIGCMPTPTKSQGIQISLVPNDLLEQIPGGVAYMPPGILPGQTAMVPGRLKAKIKRPPKPCIAPLNIRTQLRFHATVPGLSDRVIRDFAGEHDLILQYPVCLEALRWPNAVLPGSTATFIWKLTNRSNRALGICSEQRRVVKVIFRAEENTLAEAGQNTTGVASACFQKTFPINSIGPQETVAFTEQVRVPPDEYFYQHYHFSLELFLGRQNEEWLDVVQACEPRLQVAAPYIHNPDAALLLVVNCNTKVEEMNAWNNLLTQSLGKPYGVWNVSLYGGYTIGGVNILDRYSGKSIIFLGNDFDFFQQGNRCAPDMMTPDMAFALATRGTRFLIKGGRSASVEAWREQVVYAQFGGPPSIYTSKKQMVLGLRELGLQAHSSIPLVAHRPSKTRGTFNKRAAKTTKTVKTKFPLERFQICPLPEESQTICVKQGLPICCKILTCGDGQLGGAVLDNLDLLAVISVLPIRKQVEFALALSQEDLGSTDKAKIDGLNRSALSELLKLSIIQELEREISRYLHEAPWPHRIGTTKSCLLHLESLYAFLNALPEGTMNTELTEIVTDIFSHLIRSVKLRTLGEKVIRFGYRRTNLRKYLFKKLKASNKSEPKASAQNTKRAKELQASEATFTETASRVSTLTLVDAGDYETRWTDSSDDQNIVTDDAEAANMKGKYDAMIQRFKTDAAESQFVLQSLVSPYPYATI